ncbi:MAG: 3'-5' exonuclease, partial [Gammaproteobacteria bacterium]
HRQGRAVRAALLALGVPSVQHVQESVFQSPEAADIERLLLAVAEPSREHLVKGALTTDLLGERAETLYGLIQDDLAWARRLDQFQGWHELWRDQGFIRMFRHVLVSERVTARLLAFPDGERRLTNVLHLAELVERASLRRQLGMDGLVQWLAERREARSMDVEDEQLRLETDQHLVKIVTVHKSKGLEYAIVFCPFLWDGRSLSGAAEALTFHDRHDNFQATLFLGSPPPAEAQRWAEEEELAERLRLLYVALTRACYRCYLVWGAANGAEMAALAWLLHRPSETQGNLTLPAAAEHFKRQTDDRLLADLARLAEAAEGAIQLQPIAQATPEPFLPPADTAASIAPRSFAGSIRPGWRMTSFSALAHQQAAELPDYDAGVLVPKSASPIEHAMSIHDFPKGAEAGQCLHTIFERLDFSACVPQAVQEVVERALLEHGFSSDWVATVAEAVIQVLATPLDGRGEIRLQGVANSRRLNELEFHYPIAGLEAAAVRQILRQSQSPQGFSFEEGLHAPSFFTGSGFMKGFIDLVFQVGTRFYIADYKSNWLGPDQSAYARDSLSAVMLREAYYLQYLLYTVALHRYLAQRLPDYRYDTHFGGVFYLFLRGMAPATGPAFGVFADRPCQKLVTTLDRYLSAGTVAGVA